MMALVVAGSAFAQTVRVAVVHAPQQTEAARRLRAELSAAGFDAVDVLFGASEGRNTAQLAHEAGAVAALRTQSSGDVELVVVSADRGEALDRVLVREGGSRADLELRAVEDLRAKLLELALPVPTLPGAASSVAPAGERAPDADAVAAKPPTPASDAKQAVRIDTHADDRAHGARAGSAVAERGAALWLGAGLGGATSVGGLGSTPVSAFNLRVEPAAGWSLSGAFVLPLSAQNVANARGSASVDVYLFGAALGVSPIHTHTLDLELGLGAGAALSKMRGVAASSADEGHSRSVWAGVGFADVSIAWQATDRMRLRATALAGGSAPRPTVSFDGDSVASWGRPFGLATLGIELAPLLFTGGS